MRAVAILTVVCGLWAGAARGGHLDVNASAAAEGFFGLEVTPGSLCIGPERVDLASQIVIANVTACSFITAVNTIVTGTVQFNAGVDMAFGNGFQTGNNFSALISPSLTRLAFVTDRTPNSEPSYKASFQLRLDDLAIDPNDKFPHFGGFSDDGTQHFAVLLKRNLLPPENRLLLQVREDNGTVSETPFGSEVMLPADFNTIELDWLAGGGTGHFRMSLNGVPFPSFESLDNDQARIDFVRWGIIDGNVDGTTGSLDQDDFDSTQ